VIQLPDNWRQWIQVRDYPKTPDYEQRIGMVNLVMNNEAGQIFGYELPVMVPTYLKRGLDKADMVQFYEICYNTLIKQLPEAALQQVNVFGRSTDERAVEVQAVSDQGWKPLWDKQYCVPYDQFMDNLRS
jgi:hypothetical protein